MASTAIATAVPRPICWIDGTPVATKVANTAHMMSAALVIVRALLASPPATAERVSAPAPKRSLMRLSRNTS